MHYPRLAQFAAPAAPRAEVWRTGLGMAGIALLYLAATYGLLGLLAGQMAPLAFARLMQAMAQGSSPGGLMLLLASFLPLGAAVIFVTQSLHARPLATLLGPGALRDFTRVLAPLLGLILVTLPFQLMDPDVGRATPLGRVLSWLPLALPLLLVQVGAEELVFRGYLLQQLAARSRNPILWMLAPSALFGALHFSPADFGTNAIWPVLWALVFGCLAADLTARAGNLGPALAFHFTTNLSSMLLVGLYGNLDGLSLYTLVINTRDLGALGPYLAVDFTAMIAAWLAARLMLRL